MVFARATERVILDPEPPLTCHDPGQAGNFYFEIMPRKKNSPGRTLSSCSLVCITWAIPICLNAHTWHVEVHILIMNNYFGVVQHVLHHNPPTILPFGLRVSGSPIYRLHPSTIYPLLGSRSPSTSSRQVHFCKFDSMMFQKQSRQSQDKQIDCEM